MDNLNKEKMWVHPYWMENPKLITQYTKPSVVKARVVKIPSGYITRYPEEVAKLKNKFKR